MRLEHRKTLPRAYARFCTVSGNARPGMPSRTARSRVAPTSHHPRAQSPRPVWVCDAGLFFVLPYKEGEVRNLGLGGRLGGGSRGGGGGGALLFVARNRR